MLSLIDALADFRKLKRPTAHARKRLLNDTFGRKKRFDAYLAFTDNIAVGYDYFLKRTHRFLQNRLCTSKDFCASCISRKKVGLKLFRFCLQEARKENAEEWNG